MSTDRASQAGFTLIEAMVALAILGIASVGIIRAAEAHVDMIHGLEQRAAAQWVAENALVELRLGPCAGERAESEVTMLGWRWNVRAGVTSSADPDIQLVTINVVRAGIGNPGATLRGFVDRGTITK